MAHPPATEPAPGVFRIPTIGAWAVNSYALVDDEGVTLVGCGVTRAPLGSSRGPRRSGNTRRT